MRRRAHAPSTSRGPLFPESFTAPSAASDVGYKDYVDPFPEETYAHAAPRPDLPPALTGETLTQSVMQALQNCVLALTESVGASSGAVLLYNAQTATLEPVIQSPVRPPPPPSHLWRTGREIQLPRVANGPAAEDCGLVT